MQMEKRVALDGPYGAVANATGFLPEVADLPVQPKVLARSAAPAIGWALNPAPIGAAPPLLERPVPPAVVAAAAPPPAPELRTPRSQAHNDDVALPGVGSRTAVYDISVR